MKSEEQAIVLASIVSAIGGLIMGISFGGSITDNRATEKAVKATVNECIIRPKVCKTRYDYYQLLVR
jgi:hypothetical protein